MDQARTFGATPVSDDSVDTAPVAAQRHPTHADGIAFTPQLNRAAAAVAIGALAVGACAVGALAIGAVAVGRLAIGSLAMRRGRIQTLEVNELRIGRLHVRELIVTRPDT